MDALQVLFGKKNPEKRFFLTCVRLVLFHGGIVDQPYVVVNVEGEERAALAARLYHDEVVKSVGLGDDQVLLDVHQLVGGDRLQVRKVHP